MPVLCNTSMARADLLRRCLVGALKVPGALLLLAAAPGCEPEDSPQSYLTYTTSLGTFRTAVVAEGPLEAKTAHTLSCPQIWPQPEIAFLVLEGTSVAKDELVVRLEAKQIELDYLNARREVEISRSESQKKDAELNLERFRLESDMKSAEAAAVIAELQLPRLEFVAPRVRKMKSLELEKSALQIEKLRRKLAALEGIQKEERIHWQLKIQQAQNKLDKSREALGKLELKAPVDGVVLHASNWATGKKVQQGDAVYARMPIARIPDLSIMQVKLQIGETETQKLEEGQKAEIVIPSLGDRGFKGKVSHIARMAKPIRRDSRVKKVEVIVEIDSAEVALAPGLTARSSIIVEEMSEVMVVPLECVFARDSLEVVYVRRGRAFVPCEVKIPHQNADFAVIQGELEEGEELALQEPGPTLIEEPAPGE